MGTRTLNWRVLLALSAASLLALAAWAAPIKDPGKKTSPEIRSLAGIKRIGVAVAPPPPMMRQADLKRPELRQAVVTMLTEAGFEVVAKREKFLPILRFELLTASDPKFEKAAGFFLVMALRQPVDLRRFELRMYTNTYQGFVVGLEGRKDLNEKVTTGVETLVKQFIALQNQAGQTPD